MQAGPIRRHRDKFNSHRWPFSGRDLPAVALLERNIYVSPDVHSYSRCCGGGVSSRTPRLFPSHSCRTVNTTDTVPRARARCYFGGEKTMKERTAEAHVSCWRKGSELYKPNTKPIMVIRVSAQLLCLGAGRWSTPVSRRHARTCEMAAEAPAIHLLQYTLQTPFRPHPQAITQG